MKEEDRAVLFHQLDELLSSEQAAMLPQNIFEDLKNICSQSRAAAKSGDFEQAERLLHSAGLMLKAEGGFFGFE